MESLLRWSIENSTPAEPGASQPPQPRKDLDPAIIDMILGKPDAERMKEMLAIAVDDTKSEDERLDALDEFEMLIESIDNANDLVKLKMWEPLQNLLTAPSSSDEIKTNVLWIIGTAVQNNPSAQNAYLALSPLRTVLSFLEPSVRSAKLRSKAVYALSGTLKHSSAAVKQLKEAEGWDTLRRALEDSDISVRRKTAFLLNAILIPSAPVQPRPAPTPTSTAPAPSTTAAPSSTSTSVVLHPTASAENAAPSGPNVQTPVHPNSHASMLADPSSASTSELTIDALENHGLLQVLIDSLVSPVPHGPDGETEGDPEFEDKCLHTYIASCHGRLSQTQADSLSSYIKAETRSRWTWKAGRAVGHVCARSQLVHRGC
ncbi:nucleotide exchange factor Fes1-domain-containing protein [Irpex lacteus]|nr:nucleotide exchange factor Fes1-domain-containing protein [Irpex lacteus]